MPIFIYSPKYVVDIGEHVFPTQKFALAAELLHGQGEFIEPAMPSREDLLLAHTEIWTDKVINSSMTLEDEMRMELPFSKELSVAHRLAASGTIMACREALKKGVGLHIGGGSHHAFADHGEGFCVLNDITCGILKMMQEKRISRAAVIDLDVHQGNGTAGIFRDEPDVFTFSMHQEDIYPMPRIPGSLDIELSAGTADAQYLEILVQNLPKVFAYQPQLVVYQAGVDCGENDLLGGLKLSVMGLRKRDEAVLAACQSHQVPVAVTLGGGYAQHLMETAELHAQTLHIFAGQTSKIS